MEKMDVPLLSRRESSLANNDLDDFDRTPVSTKGFRTTVTKATLYLLLCVLSGGLIYLLSRWILRLRVWLLYGECEMKNAEYVWRQEKDPAVGEAGTYLETVVSTPSSRYYVHKGLRFVFDNERGDFFTHAYPVDGVTFHDIRNLAKEEQAAHFQPREARMSVYGPNEMHVPVPSIPELLVEELLHPFYVFQIFSVAIWLLQVYWIYATAIFILATAGLIFGIRQTRANNASLQRMAKQHAQVSVIRGDRKVVRDSMDLVPGDLVSLEDQSNHPLVCDMILLSGECVVNESSLTGESVPVIKTAISSDRTPFRYNLHAKHLLFCGTNLRRVRDAPVGLVVRTGYLTAKGEMIRQILYPKVQVFRFFQDALIFLAVLFVITIAGFIWSIVQFVSAGAPAMTVAVRVLDLFTIVIPPALPIAMTAGASFAVARLRKRGIFCIVPKSVNVAGRVNVMCFDKTGTLTHDHMDVYCVRSCSKEQGRFDDNECKRVSEVQSVPLLWALASCHSVVKLSALEIVGDPLEVQMMQWTGWTPSGFDQRTESERSSMQRKSIMHSPTSISGKQEIETLIRHEFSSMLARMSVVVRVPDGTIWALVKGSPEQIQLMCVPESVPRDFGEVLSSYTAQGMRTIALAGRQLSDPSMMGERDLVESSLTFFGLLVMVNPLKEESTALVRELQEAQVRVVMITGDNALTAVQVARQCGIARIEHTSALVECEPHSSHLSVTLVKSNSQAPAPYSDWAGVVNSASSGMDIILTGHAYDALMQESVETQHVVLHDTKVFARTSPIQKSSIVASLKRDGIDTVGMCGDGANDCGALKTADAGLSISEGEAAIAAPFTADSVLAIKHLLLEGRCALATSFTLFKFMILYSVIQFVGVIICYVFLNLFADLQFLWVDLFLILPLSFTMGLTGPVSHLSASRPPATLFRLSVIASILGQIILITIAHVVVIVWATRLPWWNSPTTLLNGWTRSGTQLVTVIFLFGNFVYVFVAIAFSIGYPFRRPFWFNWLFTLALAVAMGCNIGWFWTGNQGLRSFWSLAPMPVSFMGPLFGVVCALGVILYLWEVFVVRVLQPRDIRMEEK